jgi:hypothetical protein
MPTCRPCNVEPYAYPDVLTELPQHAPDADVTDGLPFNFAKRVRVTGSPGRFAACQRPAVAHYGAFAQPSSLALSRSGRDALPGGEQILTHYTVLHRRECGLLRLTGDSTGYNTVQVSKFGEEPSRCKTASSHRAHEQAHSLVGNRLCGPACRQTIKSTHLKRVTK